MSEDNPITEVTKALALAFQTEGFSLTPSAKSDWFKLSTAYEKGIVYAVPEIVVSVSENTMDVPYYEKLYVVGSLYSILFLGIIPTEWPSDLGTAIYITLYHYAKGEDSAKILQPPAPEKYLSKLKKGSTHASIVTKLRHLIREPINQEHPENGSKQIDETSAEVKLAITVAERISTTNDSTRTKVQDYLKRVIDTASADRHLLLYTYFLRLAVKRPVNVARHWESQRAAILGWASIDDHDSFRSPNTRLWECISQRLMTWLPAIASCLVAKSGPEAAEARKWFGSRVELYGMAITQCFITLQERVNLSTLVEVITQSRTEKVILRNLVTYIAYILFDTKKANVLLEKENVVLEQEDCDSGRYARCFGTGFLSWATFNNDKQLSSLLMGIKYSARTEFACNETTTFIDSILNIVETSMPPRAECGKISHK